MSLATRISSQRQIAYVPHTSVSGECWQLIQQGETTGAGAAGGTTLVDTNGDSGAADTFNGRYWVKCRDGANENLWKRIVDDDGAGTLTLENNGFPNQVASGVDYEIWLSPEPVIVVDDSADETDVDDAVRAEATNQWVGYFVVPITGARRGRAALVLGSTSGGVFTLSSTLGGGLGGALAAGDVCLLRKYFEAGDISANVAQGFEPSPMDRLDGSRGDGRVVSRSGSITFSAEAYGANGWKGAQTPGDAAEPSQTSELLQACGYKEVIGTASQVGAGSTTTAVSIATGSWENHPIDSPIVVNGELVWVDGHTDGGAGVDTLSVAPPLSIAPVSGQTAYAGRSYRRNRVADDGDYLGVCIEYEIDGVRHTMTGCKGNVATVDGERLMLAFDLQVDHWVREIERAPYPDQNFHVSRRPIMATERRCWIDSTKTDMGGITHSLNNEVAPRTVQGSSGVNGRQSFGHVRSNAGGTFRQLLDATGELPADERFGARTKFAWSVVYGGGYLNTCGVRIPNARVIQDPKPEDANGIIDAPNVVQAQDTELATLGDSSVQRLGDFVLSFA